MITHPSLQWQTNTNSEEKRLVHLSKKWDLLAGLLALLLSPFVIYIFSKQEFHVFNYDTLILAGCVFLGLVAILNAFLVIIHKPKAGSHFIWLNKYSMYYRSGHSFAEHYYADILQIMGNDLDDITIQIEGEKNKPATDILIPFTAFNHSSLERDKFLTKLLGKVKVQN